MTYIRVSAASGRARLETRAGALVPRVIETGPAFAHVAIVAGGALLLGGDSVRLSVNVGAGCALELEDIGGTVAYNADGVRCEWIVDVTVEENALLIWHGLPFVVADGANVHRRTRINLSGRGALACLRETIVLGRTGERGGTIDLRTTVHSAPALVSPGPAYPGTKEVATEPLFVEQLTVSGAEPVPGVFGGNHVLDSLMLLGTRAPADLCESLRPAPASAPGSTEMLQLEGPASIVRSLQHEAHRSVLTSVWTDWCAHALSVHAGGSRVSLPAGVDELEGQRDSAYEAQLQ